MNMDCAEIPPEYRDKQWWDVVKCPSEIKDQYFGFELDAGHFEARNAVTMKYLPPDAIDLNVDTGFSRVINDDQTFEIHFTYKPFAISDVTVSVVDGMVIIRCQHGSVEEGQGMVSRRVERSYVLPKNCDRSTLKTYIRGDVLSIECMKCDVQPETLIVISVEPEENQPVPAKIESPVFKLRYRRIQFQN